MKSINFFSLLLILSAIMFLPFTTKAQVTIGSTATPQDFSVLELIVPDPENQPRGFRLPQLNAEQRETLGLHLDGLTGTDSVAAMGLQIFNTTNQCVETWNGERWISFCRSDGDKGDDGVYIGSVFWARSNVDLSTPTGFAPNPQDPGMFFKWGNNRGWRSYGEPAWWNGSDWTTGGWDDPESAPSSDVGVPWNGNRGPCPPNWRLPTPEEAFAYVTYIYGWVNDSELGGTGERYGLLVGDEDTHIFFPAVGWRLTTGEMFYDGRGWYWGDTGFPRPHDAVATRMGEFENVGGPHIHFEQANRAHGFSVRCVRRASN